jgi:hypothetical protein
MTTECEYICEAMRSVVNLVPAPTTSFKQCTISLYICTTKATIMPCTITYRSRIHTHPNSPKALDFSTTFATTPHLHLGTTSAHTKPPPPQTFTNSHILMLVRPQPSHNLFHLPFSTIKYTTTNTASTSVATILSDTPEVPRSAIAHASKPIPFVRTTSAAFPHLSWRICV